jgi:flagellar biosynthesis protein FlhF
MLIKNFQADSMHEAMKRVKQEFGTDAVILNSQVIEEKGLPGSKPKKRFEITAGKDVPTGSRMTVTQASSTRSESPRLSVEEKRLIGDVGLVIRRFEKELNYLVHSQKEIRALLKTPAEAKSLCAHLEVHDFEKDLIAQIFNDISGNSESSKDLEKIRAALLRNCVNPQPIKMFASGLNKAVFVGPPGSGKSALLSKIATNFVFKRGIRTTLVNMDDYQPFAGKSLSAYADILKIPCHDGPEWSEPRILDDFHVILADTKGIPIGAKDDIEELQAQLEKFNPDEIHLVLPAYCLWREASRWLEFFAPLGLTQIAVTFLDQTESYGLPFNLAGHKSHKLSYFSWGRNKASMVEEADLFSLSNRIFEKVEDFDVQFA